MNEEFIIIGQHMADGDGVVLFVGEPTRVRIHEEISTRLGAHVQLYADIKPGYKKYRAATFADAMAMYQRTLELEQS